MKSSCYFVFNHSGTSELKLLLDSLLQLMTDWYLPRMNSVTLSVKSKSKSKLCYERRSVGQSVFVPSTHLGLTTRFLLLSDSCGFVDVGRSLWQENGSAVYNCCWSSPAQSFLGQSPAELVTVFYGLRFKTSQPAGPGPRIYIPQEQGGPVIPPGTGFPFHRLLRLAGLRWRHSNQSPCGILTPSVILGISYSCSMDHIENTVLL
jgi:hypothetical protein